jgi:hypothetical protein
MLTLMFGAAGADRTCKETVALLLHVFESMPVTVYIVLTKGKASINDPGGGPDTVDEGFQI